MDRKRVCYGLCCRVSLYLFLSINFFGENCYLALTSAHTRFYFWRWVSTIHVCFPMHEVLFNLKLSLVFKYFALCKNYLKKYIELQPIQLKHLISTALSDLWTNLHRKRGTETEPSPSKSEYCVCLVCVCVWTLSLCTHYTNAISQQNTHNWIPIAFYIHLSSLLLLSVLCWIFKSSSTDGKISHSHSNPIHFHQLALAAASLLSLLHAQRCSQGQQEKIDTGRGRLSIFLPNWIVSTKQQYDTNSRQVSLQGYHLQPIIKA